MKNVRLGVVGSTGRMGTEVIRLVREDSGLEFVVGIARSDMAPLNTTVRNLKNLNPSEIDLVIDFSTPEALDEVITWCSNNEKPLVSGTTGISEETKQLIKKASQKTAILWSPNMSLGIAILNQMISKIPKTEGFDYQIEEIHHINKKDKPSGTALLLQNSLESHLGRTLSSPLSIRGGGIFGIHKIYVMGEEEVLTLEHNALNRAVFAKGAIIAAKWLNNKPPGLYRMSDVLGEF